MISLLLRAGAYLPLRVAAAAILQAELIILILMNSGFSVVIQHDYYGVEVHNCYVAFDNHGIDDWGC